MLVSGKKKGSWKKAATMNLIAGRLAISKQRQSLIDTAEMQRAQLEAQSKIVTLNEDLHKNFIEFNVFI